MRIGNRIVGGHAPAWIIAEIGINHGGDEDLCARMIEAAAAAGADAVKLQTVTPEQSYHPDTDSFRVFSGCGLSVAAMRRLRQISDDCGVEFFSTPGDPPALEDMLEAGMRVIKISSGLLTNTPLLERAAATGLPLILSTGMASFDEIAAAVAVARAAGAGDLAVLQCTAIYPAPAESLNLAAMAAIAQSTGAIAGYSDHYDGTLACVAAVAMGAKIIEKHFTTSRALPGGDNAVSIELDDFRSMTDQIRLVEAMIGAALNKPDRIEIPLRDGRWRKLVAARDLPAGTTVTGADLLFMRMPAGVGGYTADNYSRICGRVLTRPVARLDPLREEDF